MHRILQAVARVLDMSDPDHEAFVDSAADCLDALLEQQEPLRALLAN
jgi:ABC-type transporter Mla subunit MlaD